VIKVRKMLLAIFSFGLLLLVSGCKQVLLNPKGLIASDEKHIMVISVLLMLIIVIPVIILTFGFAWRYRASNTKAVYAPNWSHSTLLEIIWWSVPCIIVSILAVITWTSTHTIDPYQPIASKEKTLTIQAISLEWKWLFIYPEQNIATINYVQFPAGVPVQFLITAEGPMNSFLIPQLAGQIYAMAGMQTKLHLIANEPGYYDGFGANFSGDGFSEMKFIARASSKEEFNEWVKMAQHSTKQLTMNAYNQLIRPSGHNNVQYFASANKDIFATAIMKTMMPMPTQETQMASKETYTPSKK
jgi:cytochrome o ubiquinol oxidase subunit 2